MTPENYFIQRFGKSAEEMIKNGELISPTHAVTLMKDFIDHNESIKLIASKASKEQVLEAILTEVSDAVKIPVDVLKSKKRGDPATARFFYFMLAKKFTNYIYKEIGALVGKDHATVTHGLKVVKNVPQIRTQYEELFEGKKKSKPVTEIPIEAKGLLIGRNPRVANMTSPFVSIPSNIIRPYSGYRVHSF